MQKIDWLRDWREAREYNSPIVILFDKNGSLTAVAVIMTMLESVKRPNGAIGWMPVDCDHYNQWKAERERCPMCHGEGSWDCRMSDVECPACNGTGTVNKKEERTDKCPECQGNGRKNIGEFCVPCNGTGAVDKKEMNGGDDD